MMRPWPASRQPHGRLSRSVAALSAAGERCRPACFFKWRPSVSSPLRKRRCRRSPTSSSRCARSCAALCSGRCCSADRAARLGSTIWAGRTWSGTRRGTATCSSPTWPRSSRKGSCWTGTTCSSVRAPPLARLCRSARLRLTAGWRRRLLAHSLILHVGAAPLSRQPGQHRRQLPGVRHRSQHDLYGPALLRAAQRATAASHCCRAQASRRS